MIFSPGVRSDVYPHGRIGRFPVLVAAENGALTVKDNVLLYVSEQCIPLVEEYTNYVASILSRKLYQNELTFLYKGFDILGTAYIDNLESIKNLNDIEVSVPKKRGELDVICKYYFFALQL